MREITDVREIQSVLRASLARFDEICRAHGLTYYLANGTLLGAVKYGGFIRWDDDADVLMPRADYDKLLSLADGIADENHMLCAPGTCATWRMPYAKFTDKKTVWKEGSFDFGCEIGVSVDVFPIDAFHPSKTVAKLQAIRCDLWKRMLIYATDPTFYTEKKGIKKAILKIIRFFARVQGYERVYEKITRFAKKTQKYPKKNMGCVVWTCHAQKEVFSADCFRSGGTLSFEGAAYPVPGGYHTYLSALYGDYRKELPPERQKSNHKAKVWWKND